MEEADASEIGDPQIRLAESKKVLSVLIPSPSWAQAEVFDYLVDKIGKKVVPLPFPKTSLDELLAAQRKRHEGPGATDNVRSLYAIVYRDLLDAKELLARERTAGRRGFRKATLGIVACLLQRFAHRR